MKRYPLARKHLDQRLEQLRPVNEFSRPPRGWLHAIRDALGMTAKQLADRLDVSQPRIVAMEKAEQRGAITLETLEQAARALDCTLVYALVPNKSLDEMVTERAYQVAKERLGRVDHTMRLEDQAVSPKALKAEYQRLAEELMRSNPRRLWDKQ